MKRIVYHIIIPAIVPAVFFTIAFMPVAVLGCFTRGLVAVFITLMSGLAALSTAMIGAKGRIRGDANVIWWVTSTLILVIPVIGLLILA
jgi:hypothetical protein